MPYSTDNGVAFRGTANRQWVSSSAPHWNASSSATSRCGRTPSLSRSSRRDEFCVATSSSLSHTDDAQLAERLDAALPRSGRYRRVRHWSGAVDRYPVESTAVARWRRFDARLAVAGLYGVGSRQIADVGHRSPSCSIIVALDMPGLDSFTAYAGVINIGQPKSGWTVFARIAVCGQISACDSDVLAPGSRSLDRGTEHRSPRGPVRRLQELPDRFPRPVQRRERRLSARQGRRGRLAARGSVPTMRRSQ